MYSVITVVYLLSNITIQSIGCPSKIDITHDKEKKVLFYQAEGKELRRFSYDKRGFVETQANTLDRNFYIPAKDFDTFIHNRTASNRIGMLKSQYTLRLKFQKGQLFHIEKINKSTTNCVYNEL